MVAKEVGLGDRHPTSASAAAQNHTRAGRNALLGQQALEHQRDDLDGGALDQRGRGLLERDLAALQFLQQSRRRHRDRLRQHRHAEAAPAAEAPPSKRRRTACSASLIAALSPGEG